MTVLFFCRRFYPHIGGVEKHVMEISKRLVTKGHRVVVVTEEMFSIKGKGSSIKVNGIEIRRISIGREDWFKKVRIWKNLWALKNLIEAADVIHCHDVFFWYLPFRFFYPHKTVYTTFHGYESYPIRQGAILMRRISEKLSWGNICIGDFIQKWYGTKPTDVSYGGVEISNIKYQISNIKKKESAVFIGRLDNQTGILEYVKAFEILKKKYSKFELLVVGDGEYKKKIDKKVKVIGFQKNPDKYFEKYNFAFVSRYLSILEAMAAKRLVVAVYDNPIKEDYLQMSPFAKFIIIENNPERLAKKIEYFLNNPDKEKELIEKAYTWVKKQTWEEMVGLYLKLWRKL